MENAGKATSLQSSRDLFHRLMSENSSGKQQIPKISQINSFFFFFLWSIMWNGLGGWEKSWEAGATPWDLGKPTPVIAHLVETGSLPNGRALVPGCGTVCSSILFCLFLISQHLKIKLASASLLDIKLKYSAFLLLKPFCSLSFCFLLEYCGHWVVVLLDLFCCTCTCLVSLVFAGLADCLTKCKMLWFL